jgi:integrase
MKGRIYTSQKCHVCGGVFRHLEGRGFFACPDHPEVTWQGQCFVRFGRQHTKRFLSVKDAERHLNFLRVQVDRGEFDIRDWQKNQPLSFFTQRQKFLSYKKKSGITKKQERHIARVLDLAGASWDKISVKVIGESEIDDFFSMDHGVGNKTLSNWKSVLTDFWTWLVRREKRQSGITMPEFPDIRYRLGWRTIVDVRTQQAIIEEVKQISFHINPRIWLGIKLLSLYPRVRPGEMRNVQEGHINLNERWIVFPQPKERDPKFIHLLPQHCDLIASVWVPRALPHIYFFRHLSGRSGIRAGDRFGPKYFKVWWDKACGNLKITGVDLYGGTKHSTVTALGKKLTPEQVQRGATGHASDAFKRYMLPDQNEADPGHAGN